VKEEVPSCRVVGVDPVGSILAGPGPLHSYKVEGIGYDFVPDVLDRSVVDEWIKTEDRESFQMARRLIRQEGMLCGGSSGSAVWAALQIAEKHGPDKRIVTMACDSVRNYMTKFIDDRWMRENGFSESPWRARSIGDLMRAIPRRGLITAGSGERVGDVVRRMKEEAVSQVPVVDGGRLVGIVTETDLLRNLVDGRADPSQAVAEVMFRNVRTVHHDEDAGVLNDLFSDGYAALVVDDAGVLLGLFTKIDLVEYLTHAGPTGA
jgi:cystathionine beta-synthase